jgi:CubicO group peptidase (beta-lactamase class C family)
VIDGHVEAGFEAVRDEFRANFTQRGELGAAVAAYVGGTKVVDLWGGYRDSRRQDRWEEDTLVLVYSTSKGMAAMAVALAHSRGLLDYDALVSSYWPEFAQNGKESITVRQLLAHQAGLSAIDVPLSARKLADLDGMASLLAAQKPAWKPGTRQGYHALTLGWYEGELIRRVDPKKRTLGRFFAEEIAAPLGLDFHFGLPGDVPEERLARIERTPVFKALPELRHVPPRLVLAMANPRSVSFRAFANPRLRSFADLDRSEFRSLEFPSGGGIGSARSIARAYDAFARGGGELGMSNGTVDELMRYPAPPRSGWHDEVLKVDTAYSLGFARPFDPFRFGSNGASFGHPGAGGSFAFADPSREVSFAYVMNRMGFYLRNDPREKALRDAVYASLR